MGAGEFWRLVTGSRLQSGSEMPPGMDTFRESENRKFILLPVEMPVFVSNLAYLRFDKNLLENIFISSLLNQWFYILISLIKMFYFNQKKINFYYYYTIV